MDAAGDAQYRQFPPQRSKNTTAMYKHLLEGNNINWMAMFALITFFIIFLVSTIVILGRNKNYVDKMAHLPLEDTTPVNHETNKSHEA